MADNLETVDDDLWEVALPSGEVKRMSLDQLDRAFQIGLIHSNTLIREGDGGEWQTLGAVAGLEDEPATDEAPTARADAEPKRISVLPTPPQDDDPNRETLAGLGGFKHVGPAGSAAPPLGSRAPAPKAVPPRAATLPMGVPSPVVVSRTPSNPPQPKVTRSPALPEHAFGPVATVTPATSRPPPLPANAFGPTKSAVPVIPTVSLEPARGRGAAQPALARPQPLETAPAAADQALQITEVRAVRPALPANAGSPPLGSAPPPPKHSGPPPLPPDAFASSAPPALSQPPPGGPGPIALVGHVPTSQPPASGVRLPPQAPVLAAPDLGPAISRARPSRGGNIVLGVFAATTLFIALHRNGVLFQVASSLGMASTYTKVEEGTVGPPSIMTPRGVERVLATEAPAATTVSETKK